MLGQVSPNVEFKTFPLFSYFEDVGRVCNEKRVDVLFRGYPLEQQVDFPLHRQIVAIPDIQHEHFPEFFEPECLRTRRAAFSRVLDGAGAIGTISEFARLSLKEQPEARCQDIFLMSPALQVEHQKHEPLTRAEKAQIPWGNFFLYAANLWKHKNHERVLHAFEQFLSRSKRSIQFLFTGHPDSWEKFKKQFGHLPIRHLGFIRPTLVRCLLEKARALVFFSLYEGFGIPLLEAFDAGTPVLCSNTTSLPEVGRDAVLTCDPTDVASMSALMTRIDNEPSLRRYLARRGKQRLKTYSWEASADNLMAACERVYRRNEQPSTLRVAEIDVDERPHTLTTTSDDMGLNPLSKLIERARRYKRAKRLVEALDLKEIDGIWSDNWIGPISVVRLKDSPGGEQIRLTGIPVMDMELTVAVDKKPIGVFPLRRNQMEEIRFHIKPGRELLLHFSRHIIDSSGRKLSFILHGSNLFSEQDLKEMVA
jgi:hypothetical protein